MRTLLLAILGVTLAAPALAHGEAFWIMNEPRYVADTGEHCCSTDCRPVEKGEVAKVDGGYVHVPSGLTLSAQSRGLYLTADPNGNREFICQTPWKFRCLFLRGEG